MARPKVHPNGVVNATYNLPESLKDAIATLAWEQRISASEVVREVLADYVKRVGRKKVAAVA